MVTVLTQSSSHPLEDPQRRVQLYELGNLRDAVEPFTQSLINRNANSDPVRLHCTIPTWSLSSDIYLDLHDLQELRSRFLVFVHDLLQSLRSSGIAASYCLAPSSSDLCFVCTSKMKTAAIDVLKNATIKRENVLLADMEHGPCLLIT